MNDQLDTLTDAQLSEAFAVECAGWKREQYTDQKGRSYTRWCNGNGTRLPPRFATSADAVLPFLEQCHWNRYADDGSVRLRLKTAPGWPFYTAIGPTFARAACIALIRAYRAQKGTQ